MSKKIAIFAQISSNATNFKMMTNKKVLYISQEITPYLPETDMSTHCRQMPQGVQERGYEVRTFMPKYGCINERRNQLHEVIRLSGLNIIIDDTDHPLIIKVATLQPARMQVYFIDNDDYFEHTPEKELEIHTSPADNDERILFFVRGVVETVKKLRWEPAVVHCSGWITALAPIYIKRLYNEDPSFRNSKVVYSLFSDCFDDTLAPRFVEKLLLDHLEADDLAALTAADGGVDYRALNKLAIDFADGVMVATEDVDEDLIAYAQASGKPLLPYPGADAEPATVYDRIVEFYNAL